MKPAQVTLAKFTPYTSSSMKLPQDMRLHEGERLISYELRAIKDSNAIPVKLASENNTTAFLFSWQENNIYPAQTIVINTTHPQIAQIVANETLEKFNSNDGKYSPLEIMQWLRWFSRFSNLQNPDSNRGLLEWYPQLLESLPTPKPFVFATSKHITVQFGEETDISIKAINDEHHPNPPLSKEYEESAYLLTCTNSWSSHSCVINTDSSDVANEVFNRTVNEFESDRDYTPQRIIDWLINRSQYHGLATQPTVKELSNYLEKKKAMINALSCENPQDELQVQTEKFTGYYSSDESNTVTRFVDEIFSVGEINGRKFILTIRACPQSYLWFNQFDDFHGLPISKTAIKGYFVQLQEFGKTRQALFLETKLKSEIEATHSEVLRRVQSALQTQEGTIDECINWLRDGEITCQLVA